MESLIIVFVVFAVLISFGYIMGFIETRKSVSLKIVRDNFSAQLNSRNNKYKPEMVYVWLVNEKKNYFNGMLTSSDDEGLYIKGGLLFFWVNEIFIPWSELKLSGTTRSFLSKKNRYLIENLGVYIAISQQKA